jgi:hypothetical protein
LDDRTVSDSAAFIPCGDRCGEHSGRSGWIHRHWHYHLGGDQCRHRRRLRQPNSDSSADSYANCNGYIHAYGNSNSYAHANRYTNSHGNSHVHSHTDCDGHIHAHADGHSHSHSHSHSNCYGYRNSYRYRNSHSNCDSYTNANAPTENDPDAKAASIGVAACGLLLL